MSNSGATASSIIKRDKPRHEQLHTVCGSQTSEFSVDATKVNAGELGGSLWTHYCTTLYAASAGRQGKKSQKSEQQSKPSSEREVKWKKCIEAKRCICLIEPVYIQITCCYHYCLVWVVVVDGGWITVAVTLTSFVLHESFNGKNIVQPTSNRTLKQVIAEKNNSVSSWKNWNQGTNDYMHDGVCKSTCFASLSLVI